MWYDECHEFIQIEPAWLFGIAQYEPGTSLRFTDGTNVIIVHFADNFFVINGDHCSRLTFHEICELGRWLGHVVIAENTRPTK